MTSDTASLPDWNNLGVLPPIRPSAGGSSIDRSPYAVEPAILVDRLGTSSERRHILEGLFQFRAELARIGIVSGFQWIDGSFLEQIELIESRSPNDMDVVTFMDLAGLNQQLLLQQYPTMFDHKQIKAQYTVDAYFVELGNPLDQESVRKVSYWYSMWSHRRNGIWKGFVRVDLGTEKDSYAQTLLQELQGRSS
jgi:hypothetical protein